MTFAALDFETAASGEVNEDRAGTAQDLAWVIDGATDVVETPLTSTLSDANWIANHI